MTLQDFVAGLALTGLIAGASSHAIAQVAHAGVSVAPSSGFAQPPQPPPQPPPCPPVADPGGFASITDGTAITGYDIENFNNVWMSPDECTGQLGVALIGDEGKGDSLTGSPIGAPLAA